MIFCRQFEYFVREEMEAKESQAEHANTQDASAAAELKDDNSGSETTCSPILRQVNHLVALLVRQPPGINTIIYRQFHLDLCQSWNDICIDLGGNGHWLFGHIATRNSTRR